MASGNYGVGHVYESLGSGAKLGSSVNVSHEKG